MTGSLLPATGGENEPDTLDRAALRGRPGVVAPPGTPPLGPSLPTKNVYFMFTDPSGMQVVQRAQLPN